MEDVLPSSLTQFSADYWPLLTYSLGLRLAHGSLHRIMYNMIACFLPREGGDRGKRKRRGGGEREREGHQDRNNNPFVT